MAKKWYMKKWYNTGGTVQAGDRAEDAFQKLAENNGWITTKATPSQDKSEHWDYQIEYYDYQQARIDSYRVDVKARKKISRKDDDYCDDLIYIELMLPKGGVGWVYRDTVDLIAFEQEHDFLIVEREKLATLVDQLVNRGKYVTDPHEARYKLFRRRDLEQVTLVDAWIVRSMAKWIWPKDRKAANEQTTDQSVAEIENEPA